MSKLLRANFTRLWKGKAFWVCMFFSFLDAMHTIIMRYINLKLYGDIFLPNEYLPFQEVIMVFFYSAVLIGFFVGTEYSNRTLRNKLITGHSRGTVYFANLIVCAAASVIIHTVYVLTTLLIGFTIFGNFIGAAGKFLWLYAVSITVAAAFASIFMPISMLIAKKSAGVTAAIITAFVLSTTAIEIDSSLNNFITNESYTLLEAKGITEDIQLDINTIEVSDNQRKIYEILYEILPTCHAIRLQYGDLTEYSAKIPLCSAAVITVTTAFGVLIFRRKDLK